VALLDINLGNELVTPVALFLKEMSVPLAIASACDDAEQIAGAAFKGVVNVGKPASERRLLATLALLVPDA
jgi:hypothetical protein